MAKGNALVRRSYFVNQQMVERATKLSGAVSEAEAIRKILAQFVEQERFWKMMNKTASSLKKGSFNL